VSADARRRSRLPLHLRLIAAVIRLVLSSLARVRVSGLDNVPVDGPLIVVANHISNADPPLVAGWLSPALGRQLHILAKASLFVPVVGWFLRRLGATPVRAGGSDIEAYRVAREILDRGNVLCVFPEGTRSPNGVLGEAKPGAAMLAARSGVPVLPVGISGTDEFLRRGERLPRFGTRVVMRVGKPFTVTLESGLPRRQQIERASDEIMRRIAALTDERHRGRYGQPSWPGGGALQSAPKEGAE
jgi:1-acyl-sn-glycerol-3-phosphate acyltransferase